jgi:protein-tyrosine-phosphatase
MFHRPGALFVCVHNSGRGQMCEAFFKHYAGDRFLSRSNSWRKI